MHASLAQFVRLCDCATLPFSLSLFISIFGCVHLTSGELRWGEVGACRACVCLGTCKASYLASCKCCQYQQRQQRQHQSQPWIWIWIMHSGRQTDSSLTCSPVLSQLMPKISFSFCLKSKSYRREFLMKAGRHNLSNEPKKNENALREHLTNMCESWRERERESDWEQGKDICIPWRSDKCAAENQRKFSARYVTIKRNSMAVNVLHILIRNCRRLCILNVASFCIFCWVILKKNMLLKFCIFCSIFFWYRKGGQVDR